MPSSFIPAARPLIGADERRAVDRVMETGMLAQGPEVAAFEKEFSNVVGGRRCIAVNSGTSALHLALLALELAADDEVIVPSFTFAATANAVVLAGGNPVFVDIDPASFCVDPDGVVAAITPKTRAVVPVHLYGHPADMRRLGDICREHGLALVEDAAQAHGATIEGRPVGSFGDSACFSFYPTKNMTSGEGGMVATASADVERLVRLLRNQGMERRYANEVVGFNLRMTDLHAAIGRVQLGKLSEYTAARQANARFFQESLEGVVVPPVANGVEHVYHQYTIRVPERERDAFAAALHDKGIGTGVYYPVPVHRLPSFGLTLALPETERASREVLSLPVYPSLTDADLDRIATAVNEIAKAGA